MGWEMVIRGCDGVSWVEKMRDGVKDGAGAWLMILTILVSFHELRIADKWSGGHWPAKGNALAGSQTGVCVYVCVSVL